MDRLLVLAFCAEAVLSAATMLGMLLGMGAAAINCWRSR